MSINRLLNLGIKAAAAKRTWELTVTHSGLNKVRVIRGTDKNLVNQKADALIAQWSEEWERKLVKESKRQELESSRELKRQALGEKTLLKQQELEYKESLQADAITRTEEAQEAVISLRNILQHTLSINDQIDWDALKDHRSFNKVKPAYTPVVAPTLIPPQMPELPHEPQEEEFKTSPGFLEKVFPSLKTSRLRKSHEDFKKRVLQLAGVKIKNRTGL